MWQCPQCKSTDLEVAVIVTVRLIQRGPDADNFETEYEGGDHEWDGTSNMSCRDCTHTDAAMSFVVE